MKVDKKFLLNTYTDKLMQAATKHEMKRTISYNYSNGFMFLAVSSEFAKAANDVMKEEKASIRHNIRMGHKFPGNKLEM